MSRWLCQLSYGPSDRLMVVTCPEALAKGQHHAIAAVVIISVSPPKSGKTKTAAPRLQDDGCERTLLTLHNLFVKQNPKPQAVLGENKNSVEDYAGQPGFRALKTRAKASIKPNKAPKKLDENF